MTCQKIEKPNYAKVSQTVFDAMESIWRIDFVLFPTLYRSDDRNVFYGKINMEIYIWYSVKTSLVSSSSGNVV